MQQLSLTGKIRTKLTKGERSRIRREGGVPAVIYGRDLGSVPFFIDEKSYKQIAAQNGKGLFELNIEGSGKYNAMIHTIDREPLLRKILHIDFHAVSLKEPVEVEVPISLSGAEEQGKKEGVVQQAKREVLIRALPADVPEFITLDISRLDIGDTIRAKDLSMPPGCELKADPEEVVISVIAPVNAPPDTEIEPKEPELVHDTEGQGVGAGERPEDHE